MKSKITLPLVFGGLPLPIYPGILMAGIMSLAAPRTGEDSVLLMTVANGFLIGSLVYPLVYVPCAIAAVVMAKKQKEALAFKVSMVPLVLLAMLAVLLVAWLQLGN